MVAPTRALPVRVISPGTADVRGHHQRVVGDKAEARAIEDHGTPDIILRRLEFADNLPQAHLRVFLLQHIGEIHFGGLQKMNQRPGSPPGFVKHVVDFCPRRAHLQLAGGDGGLTRFLFSREIRIHAALAHAR